ncbi:hypothetical protein OIU78_022297 [Salix suchowensis]|nr:hypothetical protein OIU78_022297 [Salix suchowensis]
MDSKHIFGGAVAAFLFGFAVLYSSRRREKIKASEKTPTKKNLKSSGNGVCRSNFAGNTDVIIVGAGVAGSALAYALAKDGWRVHVIERDLTEPDRIVGEFLHAGGCIKLAELGLEDCLDGSDSQTVFSFAAVHKDGKRSAISYPSNASGRGFHHGRFVQKLREKAASLPNVKLEQGTVTSLVEENGSIKGVLYKTKAGQELAASASLTIIEVPSYSVGLVLEDYDLPYANRAYFILKDTIAIVYPISSKEIRCLVDVPGPKPPSISTGEMASYLKTVVAPQMPAELYNAFICAIDKGNIRTMPNRIMPASSYPTPGAFLIGDSLNMRHSVTGGGMTVGLSDVVLLRDLLRPLNDLSNAASICKYLESFCVLRKAQEHAQGRWTAGPSNPKLLWLIVMLSSPLPRLVPGDILEPFGGESHIGSLPNCFGIGTLEKNMAVSLRMAAAKRANIHLVHVTPPIHSINGAKSALDSKPQSERVPWDVPWVP